jgi:hypothetical protein
MVTIAGIAVGALAADAPSVEGGALPDGGAFPRKRQLSATRTSSCHYG